MNRRIIFVVGILVLAVTLGAFAYLNTASPVKADNSPSDWFGTWQLGPNLDTTILGCPSGNGLGRYTGIYYPADDRVYFLGGRCENNTTTTGSVFYFDPETETYGVTGESLVTPVSNYQMVQVDDDGRGFGPGFYVIGGRTADGLQTADVQVYYPGNNTAEVISTDPFPPAVLYSPGGVVALGGKIYVFGGFDGTNMYASTYIYDTAAPAGARWTLSACDLPTARSYISAVGIGTRVYAIGGDEFPGSLTPIVSTLVFDVNNPGACWQDGLMADLPQANGDAPAVFVNERYLGGGIFIIGGYWPVPGPYRWVFRYDVVGDTWESVPDLAIPAPATGRRNQAAVYVPSTSGAANPALWTFGGYDGSGTNAMTETSESFDNLAEGVYMTAAQTEIIADPGTTVTDDFSVLNLTQAGHTFDLSYESNVSWAVTLPPTLGPVAPGTVSDFTMSITIAPDASPCSSETFTVTATAQDDNALIAETLITVRTPCNVTGRITDKDTGLGIENAYVWAQTDPNGLVGEYYDNYTDADGYFTLLDVVTGTYYFGADAVFHQPSFYPDGWPGGAIMFTLGAEPIVINVDLVASHISWDPTEVSVALEPGAIFNQTLTITNNGSGPYAYNFSMFGGTEPLPPQIGEKAIPDLDRVDAKILTDIEASPEGTANFVVVLNSQADLSNANGITDWNARGQAVYDMLTSHANASQASLRKYLDSQGASYTPLYIINAVIVQSGNSQLVDSLSARPDVAQLVGNHEIAVDQPSASRIENMLQQVSVPNAVGWNISKIGADQVWSTYGTKGEGMVVAEIDTGTQYDHPALVNQYRGNLGGGTFDHNYNWYDPYSQCPDGGNEPCDPGGHGTHVMGTMVGDDGDTHQIGVAPGAKWISCKGGDADSGYLLTNELLVCAQWILAPFDLTGANPNPAMRPNVVNNSWGGGPNDYWYGGAVDAWRAAGIFPAFANGNAGPGCSTAHSPGDYWQSFATGATSNTDALAGFSSRGPAVGTNFLKPQIVAPGVSICSSVPGSGYSCGYSGTSMASPHTAGAIALLWSAVPQFTGQIDVSGWTLEQTAVPLNTQGSNCGGDYVTGPNNDWGYGRLNILDAVTLARSNLTLGWFTVDPMYGTVNAGDSADITLAFTAPEDPGVYTATLMLVGDDPYNPDVRIPLSLTVEQNEFTILLPLVRK